MRNGYNWLNVCLIISVGLLAASCQTLKGPKIAICIIGDGGCACHDQRLPEADRNYILPFEQCKNFIATPPDDFQTLQEFMVRRCKVK